MFGWMKREAQGPATSLAMIGPRAADSVLFQGAGRPSFAAEVGTVTRLNGRTVVVGDKAQEADVERAGEAAGALLEFTAAPLDALPFEPGTFHIVATTELAEWPAGDRALRLAEATRVLQPGGRLILIVGGPGEGVMGRLKPRPTLEPDAVINLMTRCGLVAARKLAESGGVGYYEGRKTRD